MEDRDFLDLIYQHWSKTTGAADMFWMPEQDPIPLSQNDYSIFAVGEDQERKFIASDLTDEDADFITAIHGCLPDLVRRLQDALDEADRLDLEKDELIGRVAELEEQADAYERNEDLKDAEIDRLNALVLSYTDQMKEQDSFIEHITNENRDLERWLDNGGPHNG